MGPEAVGDPCFPCQGLYIPDSQEINKEIVQKVIRIGNSNFDWNKKESK